jgi:hypothetical protein
MKNLQRREKRFGNTAYKKFWMIYCWFKQYNIPVKDFENNLKKYFENIIKFSEIWKLI